MQLGLDLPAYWPDWSHPVENLFPEMIEAAQHAEDLGFTSFALAEHHFVDYFISPAPLALASHLAAVTRSARFLLSVICLPHNDVRRVAGEINTADHLTKGRLDIGVGRGSNRYEPGRFGLEFGDLRAIFADQMEALVRLLHEKDVVHEGPHVRFPSLTIMPPPYQRPHAPLWIAAVTADSAYKAARDGFNVQTASLRRPFSVVREIVQAIREGTESGAHRRRQQVSMGTWVYVARDDDDVREKLGQAYANHRRFVNLSKTPGTVIGGMVEPLEIQDSVESVGETLIIGPPSFCVDKLLEYQSLGLDHLIIRKHFGPSHGDIMGSLDRFAEHVMPHLDVDGTPAETAPAPVGFFQERRVTGG